MSTNTLKLGSKAPEFNLIAVDGNKYTLDSFLASEVLIVIFSCNHCPYVQAYEQRIIDIQNDFGKKVQIAAINSNDAVNYPEDSFESMKRRAKEKGFNFVYLRDEDQSVAKAYDAAHTPEVFVFDKDRRLAYHGKIDDNWKDPHNVTTTYLRDAINDLLERKEVLVKETFSIGCTIKWKND